MRETRYKDYEMIERFHVWAQYRVHIIFTHSIVDSFTKRFDEAHDNLTDTTGGYHYATGTGHSFLFYSLAECPVKLLVHEAWHAIRYMFDDYLSAGLDNETIAYHLGWLCQKVCDFKSKVEEHVNGKVTRGQTGGMPDLHTGVPSRSNDTQAEIQKQA